MNNFKERYVKMRNEGKYDLQFFFNYYLSKGGKLRDPEQFVDNFLYEYVEQQVHPAAPPMRIRTGERDKQAILNHLDGVFEVNILTDSRGNFIKAIG